MSFPLRSLVDLHSLCENGVSEGLNLEFKQKEDPRTPTLGRVDKKNIAQAVSSFANSDGGILIFGIRSVRYSGLDVAQELVPIAEVDHFLAQFQVVCSLNVSPDLVGLTAWSIYSGDGEASGFVVCEIERSNRRPHMSTAPGVHSYYRRSFEGAVPMTPSEVRDQILAVRDAILQPVVKAYSGGSFTNHRDWISARTSIGFHLKNVGQALCKNPFLRVQASCELHSHSYAFDHALQAWKTDFPYGTLIHVDDQKSCFSLSLIVIIRADVLGQKFDAGETNLTDAVIVPPGSTEFPVQTISDKVSLEGVDFKLRYGAENAPATESVISLSRRDIAKRLLEEPTVRDMALHWPYPFRLDLVTEFAAS